VRVEQRLDYALRLLVAISRLPEGQRVAVGDLAEAMDLPRRFCEQQITELSRHGLVSCRRGAGGGCKLAVRSDELTVAEVAKALQGTALDVPHTHGSATTQMWEQVAAAIEEHLAAVSIAELAERQAQIDRAGAAMYQI
jgi:Rrf2 family protein